MRKGKRDKFARTDTKREEKSIWILLLSYHQSGGIKKGHQWHGSSSCRWACCHKVRPCDWLPLIVLLFPTSFLLMLATPFFSIPHLFSGSHSPSASLPSLFCLSFPNRWCYLLSPARARAPFLSFVSCLRRLSSFPWPFLFSPFLSAAPGLPPGALAVASRVAIFSCLPSSFPQYVHFCIQHSIFFLPSFHDSAEFPMLQSSRRL